MAKVKQEKRARKISPIGEAKWAHVQEPKAAFMDENGRSKGEPKYQIDVVFDPTAPEWAAWMASMKTLVASIPSQINPDTGEKIPHQALLRREKDQAGEPTGRLYFTAKTSAKFRPGLFDAQRNPLPDGVLIGNGSKIRIAYTENVYDAFGGGINLYLEGVQVIRLVEHQRRTAADLGFGVEEGDAFGGEDLAPF